MLHTGSNPPYFWLASEEHYISELVELCPEVFIDRYLAVTCIDCGEPWLTDAQRATGWQVRDGFSYSPKLTGTKELSFQRDGPDAPGWDEWYLSTEPLYLGRRTEGHPAIAENAPAPGRFMLVIPNSFFLLHEPGDTILIDAFWRQMGWVSPESFVGDGADHLYFVTRNAPLFDLVHSRLSQTSS